ncbi:hypothetical protein N656DRAFT_525736 [Canariomyces notabilis]|uniref:Uncharacterized protein n=1 Tax=Canariomyces notabilis TaxID=2074819 RepID=A0AAN6TID4_9PEZI|nr:hypothetical protein N656DRAFT_525736 [Canariomyces arenarius]
MQHWVPRPAGTMENAREPRPVAETCTHRTLLSPHLQRPRESVKPGFGSQLSPDLLPQPGETIHRALSLSVLTWGAPTDPKDIENGVQYIQFFMVFLASTLSRCDSSNHGYDNKLRGHPSGLGTGPDPSAGLSGSVVGAEATYIKARRKIIGVPPDISHLTPARHGRLSEGAGLLTPEASYLMNDNRKALGVQKRWRKHATSSFDNVPGLYRYNLKSTLLIQR